MNIDKMSPMPLIQGQLCVEKSLPLEKLQAKLPNLADVYFRGTFREVSFEFIAEFCRAFPMLTKLSIVHNYKYEDEPSDDVVSSIISLQNLRVLHISQYSFTYEQLHTIVQKASRNIEELHFGSKGSIGRGPWEYVARMPKLRRLRVPLASFRANFEVFRSPNNFSMLQVLTFTDCGTDAERSFKFGFELSKFRPQMKFR